MARSVPKCSPTRIQAEIAEAMIPVPDQLDRKSQILSETADGKLELSWDRLIARRQPEIQPDQIRNNSRAELTIIEPHLKAMR